MCEVFCAISPPRTWRRSPAYSHHKQNTSRPGPKSIASRRPPARRKNRVNRSQCTGMHSSCRHGRKTAGRQPFALLPWRIAHANPTLPAPRSVFHPDVAQISPRGNAIGCASFVGLAPGLPVQEGEARANASLFLRLRHTGLPRLGMMASTASPRPAGLDGPSTQPHLPSVRFAC